jgi:hypothetical protein
MCPLAAPRLCEKRQKQKHAGHGTGADREQMPFARVAPVPQRPGTDQRRLEWKHPGVAREREGHRETEDEIEPRADGLRRARDGRHDGERQELQQKAR